MRSKKIFSKKYLAKFIRQGGFRNTASFLHSLRTRTGLERFYKFCEENKISLNTQRGAAVLFHGSGSAVDHELMPHASMGAERRETKKLVYATNDPNYAIFLATIRLAKGGIASVRPNTKGVRLFINMGFVNGASKLRDGYVHVLSAKGFKKSGRLEYTSASSVQIICTIRVSPSDLTVPIQINTK